MCLKIFLIAVEIIRGRFVPKQQLNNGYGTLEIFPLSIHSVTLYGHRIIRGYGCFHKLQEVIKDFTPHAEVLCPNERE